MENEKAIQIDNEANSNQERKNSADSEYIPEQLTDKFGIKKGKGIPLKDICHVVSVLENKVHSFSEALHCILYGDRDEVEGFKKDVLEFSGFVSDDEYCQRDMVKERLERCTREMLSQLFYVFDISVENAFYAMNKKKIIQILLDFMEAPYEATRETESSDRECSEMDTVTSLEIVHKEENKSEDDTAASNEPEEMRCSEKEENTISEKPKDCGANLSMNILDVNVGSRGSPSLDLNVNSSSQKLTRSIWELEKSKKKQKIPERRVAQGGDKQLKEWCDPSCEEVQKAISIILEETDITTATFSDVLEELDERFEMDLSPRKDAIMVMIEEELYRLANEVQEQEIREENQEQKKEETRDGNVNNSTQVPVQM